jgi:inward rectifier potassium channel
MLASERIRSTIMRSTKPKKRPPPHPLMPGGQSAIERIGYKSTGIRDTYHLAMTVPFVALLGALAAIYLLANAGFALLYLIFDGGIVHARPGSFEDAFFFSVQTMATIGYGNMYPNSLAANLIATGESIYGLLTVALSTGVMFARVSRPTARIAFSKVAVVAPHDGVPTLMFRAANQRRNQIVEAQATVTLLRAEAVAEGDVMRRFYELKLVRSRSPVFALSWTVMHPLDQDSPLYGATPESLANQDVAIICSINGIDETFAQTVHARYVYDLKAIHWNKKFVDIFREKEDGRRVIDYTHFHETVE